MVIHANDLVSISVEDKRSLAGLLIRDLAQNRSGLVQLDTAAGGLFVYFEPLNPEELTKVQERNCSPEYRETLKKRYDSQRDGIPIEELIDRDFG